MSQDKYRLLNELNYYLNYYSRESLRVIINIFTPIQDERGSIIPFF